MNPVDDTQNSDFPSSDDAGSSDMEPLTGEESVTDTPTGVIPVKTGRKTRERKPRKPRKPYRFAKARRVFWTLVLIWVVVYCINWYFVERRLYAQTKWGAFHKLAVFTYYETTGYKEPIDNTLFAKWIRAECNKATECYIPSISTRYTDKTSFGNKLLSLDRRYGHIPEYWEMRPAGSGMARSECLKRAGEMNPDRPDIKYYRACAEYTEIREEYDNPAEINPNCNELVLDAAREASLLEPDNGAWKFLLAVELNNLGEWDESIEQFRIAAKAPKFRMPALFPESEYLDTMYDLRTNPEVASFGIGFLDCVSFPGYHLTMASKKAYRNSLVSLTMNDDIESLNILYKCAVRMACGDIESVDKGVVFESNHLNTLNGLILISILTDWYKGEYGADLSEEDLLAFNFLTEWRILGIAKYHVATPSTYYAFKFLSLNTTGNPYRFYAERQDNFLCPTEEQYIASKKTCCFSKLIHGWIVRDENSRMTCDHLALDAITMSKQSIVDFAPLMEFDFRKPAASMKRVFAKADELRKSRSEASIVEFKKMKAETAESEKTE